MKKQGIIFDMDGTMWDSSEGVAIAWMQTIEEMYPGLISLTKEDIMNVMGMTMDDIADALFGQLEPMERNILMDHCCGNENEYLRKNGGIIYDGLEETLQKLKKDYSLFIVSNCQRGYIEAFLEYYGLEDYFEDTECFGNNGLPKGDNIARVVRRNALTDAVYVGDIQGDYEASQKAGIKFIHAAYGFGSVHADVPKIEKLADLPQVVSQVFGGNEGSEADSGNRAPQEEHLEREAASAIACGFQPDFQRKERCGFPEVIFCSEKPDEYLVDIYRKMYEETGEAFGTRASLHQYEIVKEVLPNAVYDPISRILKVTTSERKRSGKIAVCTAGTADIPVAEEAAQTAEYFGSNVVRIYDVGVSGIHRLLERTEELQSANCVIAVAGMEGALASVIGGLVSNPVIAVPTSVGYGASLNGLSALLTMINSCANGVSVVNIDNGYGAGYIATQMNRLAQKD